MAVRAVISRRHDHEKGQPYMRKLIFIMIITLISMSASADEKRFSVPIGDSPSTGPANAPVTIIEFLDFQ
jgi:hypothetical protein